MGPDKKGREDEGGGAPLIAVRPARLVHPAFRFGSSSKGEAVRLAAAGVGGFCLYGGTAAETLELTRELRASASEPLLFSSDYEDGTGQRLSDGTLLPNSMALAASGDPELVRRKGEITGIEALAVGVDWVLAPVADLADEPSNPIVATRAFGSEPRAAAVMAEAYIKGVRSAGAVSCVKHFPGHGPTSEDSHLSLPSLPDTRESAAGDLEVFAALSGMADSVMAGHLLAPWLDRENPVSLSRAALAGLLRGEIGFSGCVVTDALEMGAVAADPEAGIKAFLAGADILLAPEDPFRLIAALEEALVSGRIGREDVISALSRQAALTDKTRAGLKKAAGLDVVGSPAHLSFSDEAAPRCMARAFGGWETPSPGERIAVLELGAPDGGRAGSAFSAALSALGLRPETYSRGFNGRLVITSFSGPRALSGRINLSRAETVEALAAAAACRSAAMVSFGSPFVFGGLRGALSCGLCAFSPLEAFQRAAAAVLAGALRPSGRMPVKMEDE